MTVHQLISGVLLVNFGQVLRALASSYNLKNVNLFQVSLILCFLEAQCNHIIEMKATVSLSIGEAHESYKLFQLDR